VETELIQEILRGGAGVIAALLLFVWWLKTETLVWGKAHRERVDALTTDRDEWQSIALDALGVAERISAAKGGDRAR
jgi:hypothetical protein